MIKLRNFRAALDVARHGSITKASRQLGLSQPAVSRSIQALEKKLGAILFERSAQRVNLTELGHIVFTRSQRAFEHLQQAETLFCGDRGQADLVTPVLSRDAADHELRAAIAIFDHGTISAAAQHLGLTQPALTRSLRLLEERLGTTIFHRTSEGMRSNPSGEYLIRKAKLAFAELRQAIEEISLLNGKGGGRLRVGALPLTRAQLVPIAIDALLLQFPRAEISILHGSYTALLNDLRNGDLDLIVGTIRSSSSTKEIRSVPLFEDDMVVVARPDHSLFQHLSPVLADCMKWPWVLPFIGVPLRELFEKSLRESRLPEPFHVVETDSVAVLRTLLRQSNRLAIVSRHQVHDEIEMNFLRILPIKIGNVNRMIGMTFRRTYIPTPMTKSFIAELEQAALRIA